MSQVEVHVLEISRGSCQREKAPFHSSLCNFNKGHSFHLATTVTVPAMAFVLAGLSKGDCWSGAEPRAPPSPCCPLGSQKSGRKSLPREPGSWVGSRARGGSQTPGRRGLRECVRARESAEVGDPSSHHAGRRQEAARSRPGQKVRRSARAAGRGAREPSGAHDTDAARGACAEGKGGAEGIVSPRRGGCGPQGRAQRAATEWWRCPGPQSPADRAARIRAGPPLAAARALQGAAPAAPAARGWSPSPVLKPSATVAALPGTRLPRTFSSR